MISTSLWPSTQGKKGGRSDPTYVFVAGSVSTRVGPDRVGPDDVLPTHPEAGTMIFKTTMLMKLIYSDAPVTQLSGIVWE